jgi:hypothetical protein
MLAIMIDSSRVDGTNGGKGDKAILFVCRSLRRQDIC